MDHHLWENLVDRKNNFRDVSNDYVELEKPILARYIRFNNISAPMRNLAISDLRIFGSGLGKPPTKVKDLNVMRNSDRRDALIRWIKMADCQGYNINWGIAPDKLYNSWMVYNNNFFKLKCLSADQEYYFAIEAFNESGVSPLSGILSIQ